MMRLMTNFLMINLKLGLCFINNNKKPNGLYQIIRYYAFIYVSFDFFHSTNKKYLCDSNFEIHFLREQFSTCFRGRNTEVF